MRHLLAVGFRSRYVTNGKRLAPSARRPTGGRARLVLLASVACVAVLALSAGSAQALLVHTTSFGSPGSAGGQFASPQGVAVDQATGDVYVVDSANFRVEKFDSSGTFLFAFGQGVDATTPGNVCTAASGDTCQAGTQGSTSGGAPPAFNDPMFVAVDNSGGPSAGDVYVGDRGDQAITKFDSNGNVITTWGTGGQLSGAGSFGTIDGITVDNSGNLLVINDGNPVFEFTQAGAAITNFGTGSRGMSALGMDVDSKGNIFKINGDSSVEEITSTGADTGQVTSSGSTALVIDRSTGDLYQDVGSGINHYQFNASGQVIEPGSAPPCTVVQNGSCAPTESFGSGVTTSGTGMGFNSSMTLLYVADAGTNTVAIFGVPSPGAPVIDGESSSNIGNQSATVNAQVNPFGVDTTCTFQWQDDATFQTNGNVYTNSAPCTPADLGSTFLDQSASANLTGLTLNTLYDFRVVATNADGTTDGANATFTTLGPAVIDSESTSNVGSTTGQLDAQINPLGSDTTCQFQYVDDTDFMATGFTGPNVVTVPCTPADLGTGSSDVAALANISGLTPSTLYDFRAVATNALGTENGSAAQFATGPPVSIDSESASNVGSVSATLNTQINPEGTDTTCQFQYVDDTDFASTGFTGANVVTVPCSPADLGSTVGDVSASTDITGLSASTTYDFRAVATNSLVPAGFDGTAQQFTTTPPVVVDSESASNVASTTATLNAQINPEGLDTHYQFQFVSDATFQSSGYTHATTVPVHAIDIGSGLTDQHATVDLTGLSPSTKYHFRVTASNSAGTVNGTDQTFKTFASGLSTGLPDGRAYEQVTPVNKDSGEPGNRNGLGGSGVAIDGQFIAASTGNAFSFFSFNAFPGSASDGGFYVANRGASSWISQNLIPPQSAEGSLLCATLGGIMVDYTSDLSRGILEDGASLIPPCGQDFPNLVKGEPQGVQNAFVFNPRATGTQPRYRLVDSNPITGSPANASFDGSSTDLSTVVFDEPAQLTANAPGSGADNLYEWSASTGKDTLVTLVPTAPATSCTAACVPMAGALAGGSVNSTSNSFGQAFHAVSDNGSKIFFTGNGNLYVRVNGSSTAQVDASKATPAGTGGGGQFLAATSSGSDVFFTDGDSAGLTTDTKSGSGANLYDYNTVSGKLTDLTGTNVLGSDGLAQVQGLTGVDSAGAFLYFVADGALKAKANAAGQSPQSGQSNLYVLHNGAITFIDTLSGSDGNDWSPGQLSARTSATGSFLAFTSTNSLTGYNNNGQSEIFLYSAGANTVVCASCIPTGVPATSGASIEAPALSTPLLSFGVEYLQHNVSNSGQVFFDTADALVPTASNGQLDVYEYEAGQAHLLSSATSVDPALFADATPNGSDVFFMTSAQLVPQDTDSAMDVYDARVRGGFPPSAPPASCSGENCKPPQSVIPPVPTIASVTFFGPGNVKGSSTSSKSKSKKKKKSARVAVLTQRITGNRIRIRVRVPARGKISVTGKSLRGSSRRIRHAGVYTLSARLKPQAMTALANKHKLKLTIRVRYVSAAGSASTATIKMTVEA